MGGSRLSGNGSSSVQQREKEQSGTSVNNRVPYRFSRERRNNRVPPSVNNRVPSSERKVLNRLSAFLISERKVLPYQPS